MLSANVQIADEAKVEGEEGEEAGGGELQHGGNVNAPAPALADGMRSCYHIPHPCTDTTLLHTKLQYGDDDSCVTCQKSGGPPNRNNGQPKTELLYGKQLECKC